MFTTNAEQISSVNLNNIQMHGHNISTCSVCGDTCENVLNGDLPKWWVRAYKFGARDDAKLLCVQCAMVVPYKSLSRFPL